MNKIILDYEAFNDRFNVIPTPTGETAITPNGNEIDIISYDKVEIAEEYEQQNPNTVWTVIRNVNTVDSDDTDYDTDYDYTDDTDDIDDNESDIDSDIDIDQDDYDMENTDYTVDESDLDEEVESYSIIPGIETMDAMYYLVTEVPYDGKENLNISFDI